MKWYHALGFAAALGAAGAGCDVHNDKFRSYDDAGTMVYVDRSESPPAAYIDLKGDGSLDIQFRGFPPMEIVVISDSIQENGFPILKRSSALARDLQSQFNYVKEMSKRR